MITSTYAKIRDIGRVIGNSAAILAYMATSEKIEELNQMRWIKRLFANLFYKGDIQKLHEFNDYTSKTLGVSLGLLAGYAVDRGSEKLMPEKKEIRKLSQIGGYFGSALLANYALNRENIKETFERVYNSATNLISNATSSDLENITSCGIMTLMGLTAVKGTDYVSKIVSGKNLCDLTLSVLTSPVKALYSATLGKMNDNYEAHRIANDYRKKAVRIEKKAREN